MVLSKQRILLVDDSTIICKRLKQLVEESQVGEIAGTCSNGLDAVNMINELMPDTVLLDINLPGTNGFEVLVWLRDSYKHRIKVVIISNHSQAEYRNMALSLGADYFLDKSTEFNKLSDVLTEISALNITH